MIMSFLVKEGRTTGEDPIATGERIGTAINLRRTNPKKTPKDIEAQAMRIGKRLNLKHVNKSLSASEKEEQPKEDQEKFKKGWADTEKAMATGTEKETAFAGTVRKTVKDYIKDLVQRN